MNIIADTTPPKLLLRLPEAAAVLGIGRTTLYALISGGELPVVRVGKAIRIPMSALRDWVERHTDQSPVQQKAG